MKPKETIICPKCGNTFLRYAHSIKLIIKRSGFWQCQGCSTTARNKANAKPIGSTRISNHGYIFEKTESGWVLQNRLVAAKKIGRPLLPDEVAHHSNEVKADNSPNNLEVKLHGEHTREHHTGAKRSGLALKNIREGSYHRINSKAFPLLSEIKQRVASGERQSSVADDLKLSRMVVNRIVKGESFKYA